MNITDAVRVIAARESIVDLDFALSLLGFQLVALSIESDEESEWQPDPEDPVETDETDETDEMGHGLGRPMVSTSALARSDDADSPDSQGLRWFWGLADEGRERASRLIPYVLESDATLSSEHTRQDRIPSVDRPRTPAENVQVTWEWIAACTKTWDHQRVRRLLLRRVPGHRIDVDEIVRLLSQGQVLRRRPVLPRSKVALPIQVVHDIGLYAGPFGFDLRALLEVVRLSSGPGLELLAFRHSLARGCGIGPVWRWHPYEIPSRASCILLVSGGYGPDPVGRALEFHHLMAALNRRGHHTRAVWFGDLPAETAPLRPEHWVVRN